jgi:hypothetical protein
MRNKIFAISSIVVIILIFGYYIWSRPSIAPAFYYWRTTVELSNTEKELLASQNINHLYVRFFDVDLNPVSQLPEPVGKVVFADKSISDYRIVPVVFITNRVFKQMPQQQCDSLAKNVVRLIKTIINTNNLLVDEIQMDCDWSETTKTTYFHFLTSLQKQIEGQNWLMSATIRLHQVKYHHKTGVPPVNRGMLMFYNMGNLSGSDGENSIYNSRDASKYTASIKAYPLPLDAAVPVFSWAVHLRDGKTIALINHASRNDFLKFDWLNEVKPLIFEVTEAQFYQGRYFKHGDRLRVETVSPQLAIEAAQLLSKNMTSESRRVAIFRLDSLTLQPYEKEDFKTIFDCFR